MKKVLIEILPKMKRYWRKVYNSTQNSITRGAQNISKIITRARKDNWRRGREKKK